MAGLGWQELLIVLVIIMIIFGAGKLPEIAKALGQGVKEFKTESNAPGVPERTAGTAVMTDTQPTANGAVIETREVVAEEVDTVRTEGARGEAASRDAI
jgi:TatA/E family protein of Tat protein translocase